MSNEILAALIGAAGAIVAAIVGVLYSRFTQKPPMAPPPPQLPSLSPQASRKENPRPGGKRIMTDDYTAQLIAELQLNYEEGDNLSVSVKPD
jgi:hypothetical protein